MYEKDGEKYFVMDSHIHFWDASPENWVKGRERYAAGWIENFHGYQSLGPPDTHWSMGKFQKYTVERLREGRLRGRARRHRSFPVDVPEGLVHERLQRRSSRTPRCSTAFPAS